MPAKRKGAKSQGSKEEWYFVDSQNCQVKSNNVNKKNKHQKLKVDLKFSDSSPAAQVIVIADPLHHDDEARSYEWIKEEQGESFEVVTPPGVAEEARGLAQPSGNLVKLLAEACEDQCAKPLEQPPEPATETTQPPSVEAIGPLDLPQKAHKKRTRKDKKKRAAVAEAAAQETHTEEAPRRVLFSEMVAEAPRNLGIDTAPPTVAASAPPILDNHRPRRSHKSKDKENICEEVQEAAAQVFAPKSLGKKKQQKLSKSKGASRKTSAKVVDEPQEDEWVGGSVVPASFPEFVPVAEDARDPTMPLRHTSCAKKMRKMKKENLKKKSDTPTDPPSSCPPLHKAADDYSDDLKNLWFRNPLGIFGLRRK